MDGIGKTGVVLDDAEPVDFRDDDTGDVAGLEFGLQGLQGGLTIFHRDVADLHAVELRIGFHDLHHVRQQTLRKKHARLLLGAGHGHLHRLRGGRRAVIQGSVGNVHARELANHALVLEDVPERALRNLALIRRVGRQELGTGGDVRNHRRGVVVIRAGAGEHLHLGIHPGETVQPRADFRLGHRIRKGIGALLDEFLRNVRIEVFHLLDADPVQHRLDIGVRMREIRESGHAYSPMWAL